MADIATLTAPTLNQLFLDARTHNGWQEREVPDALLQEVLDLAKMGPTAFNCQPLRVVFLRSPEAKARLAPALSAGNLAKTMAAPVTALMCYDLDFWTNFSKLLPSFDAAALFRDNAPLTLETAVRNGNLQAGYFIMAARALGLDCGPMSGFDAAKAQEEFLAGRRWQVNFLINLGYGRPEELRPRAARLEFATMAEIL